MSYRGCGRTSLRCFWCSSLLLARPVATCPLSPRQHSLRLHAWRGQLEVPREAPRSVGADPRTRFPPSAAVLPPCCCRLHGTRTAPRAPLLSHRMTFWLGHLPRVRLLAWLLATRRPRAAWRQLAQRLCGLHPCFRRWAVRPRQGLSPWSSTSASMPRLTRPSATCRLPRCRRLPALLLALLCRHGLPSLTSRRPRVRRQALRPWTQTYLRLAPPNLGLLRRHAALAFFGDRLAAARYARHGPPLVDTAATAAAALGPRSLRHAALRTAPPRMPLPHPRARRQLAAS